jgi:2,4-dienoyl-CoA reductase-like NADH-dependent reductase (Old Yellow Enzyme family)
MAKLFTPITLRELTLHNRVLLAPMCQYSCENRDGVPSDWHFTHYVSRAVGGFSLVVVEATGVSAEGRITPWCTGIYTDEQIEAWTRITDAIRANGSRSAIQLAHAGRKASTYRAQSGSGSVPLSDGGWQSVSSTAEAFPGYEAPRELTTAEVYEVIEQWHDAARNAIEAGFDALEIHAAHGYLIHQFLSPITNQRTDEFGGSLENRARLLLSIIAHVRDAMPTGMPLIVRFSATDYREDGWDIEQTKTVAKWCAEAGVDLFDISSGGLITGVTIPSGPGYQVPLAAAVSAAVDEPVSAVGQITEAKQANEIIESGAADVVSIGRAALRDPYWPLRAAAELGAEITWPKQYERGAWPKAN